MKRVLLAFLAVVGHLFGANYYVATTGNDSNPGTVGSPWLTLSHALGYASLAAGDTINLAAGNYTGASTTSKAGTNGNVITITGAGVDSTFISAPTSAPLDDQFIIANDYYKVTGITFDKTNLSIKSASYGEVANCAFRRGNTGIHWTTTTTPSLNWNVHDCEFSHPATKGSAGMIALSQGSGYTIHDNYFHDNAGGDLSHCLGQNHTFSKNLIRRNISPATTSYLSTSATTNTIGTGTQTFTIEAGKAFSQYDDVSVYVTGSTTQLMRGWVTSYSGTTLVLDVWSATGSGTFSAWNVGLTSYGNYTTSDKPNHADIVQCFYTASIGANVNTKCTNLTFEQNQIEDCTGQFGNLENNAANDWHGNWTVRNNKFIRSRTQINCYIPGMKFYTNTVYDNLGDTVGFRAATSATKGDGNPLIVQDNIFCRVGGTNSGAGAWSKTGANPATYNFLSSSDDSAKSSYPAQTGQINGGYTPYQLFVDPDNGDLRLKPGSPVIGAGTNLSSTGYSNDILGVTRITPWDMGAYAYGTTPPTLVGATINAAGTSLTLNFSVSCSNGAGGSGGMTVAPSDGAATVTYSSGSGSSTYVFTVSRAIHFGETLTVSYVQPGNGIEATADQVDLQSFSSQPVTNNSTNSGTVSPTLRRIAAISGGF